MKREGVQKGIPDVFAAIPVAPHHGMFIEAKDGNKALSDEQEAYFKSLTIAGYKCVKCTSAQQMIDCLKDYLLPLYPNINRSV